ncbi:MAG: hypothetical protein PHQ66_03505 [Candidatus Nanoarchaeia archaeon]|nr:hypothetical protein [Candidatus Nanoarchaeia archaeon]MDD5357571.1 hypothetical protein [Candidatus Nanoarchaeia archaeon]MDD5588490.1 hypothetical protein [Candidatus Nanoarchaeia archaeon]
MRKIISREEEERKRKGSQLLVGGILILVMVLSVLGYSLGSQEEEKTEKVNYGGFSFLKQNGFWILDLENLKFYFEYNPNEVEKIGGVLNPLKNYLDKPVYIYSENSEAEAEIYKNLFYYNQIVERMQNACPEEEKCDESWPVKTCENNFVILRESNETGIKQEGNCVFIDGKREDLVELSDVFLYKIIGIQ